MMVVMKNVIGLGTVQNISVQVIYVLNVVNMNVFIVIDHSVTNT